MVDNLSVTNSMSRENIMNVNETHNSHLAQE